MLLTLSGTSMSAAVVSGVLATLEQATGRALTPNLAKGVLQFTAIPQMENGQRVNPLRQGTGVINAKGALNVLNHVDATITDLTETWLQHPVAKETTIGGEAYAWAGNIVWADNMVWGDSVFYNLPIWGLNIVWGDNIVWGNVATLAREKGRR